MDLKEFYEEIGSDYNKVIGRFGGAETLVRRFLGKFKDDKSFSLLKEGIESENLEAIERGSHSLKGVAANLGLTRLQENAETVLAHVRGGGDAAKAAELFEAVDKEYTMVIDKLEKL